MSEESAKQVHMGKEWAGDAENSHRRLPAPQSL